MLQNISIIILSLSILYLIYRNQKLSNRIDKAFKSISITDSLVVALLDMVKDIKTDIEVLEDIQDDIIDCLCEEEKEEVKETKKK